MIKYNKDDLSGGMIVGQKVGDGMKVLVWASDEVAQKQREGMERIAKTGKGPLGQRLPEDMLYEIRQPGYIDAHVSDWVFAEIMTRYDAGEDDGEEEMPVLIF